MALGRPGVGNSWHPHGQWVAVAGFGEIHVVRAGQQTQGQPEVVLLHGFLQSSWTWRFNLDALAQHFAVTAVCLPGFGWSDKPRGVAYRLMAQAERVLGLCDALGIGAVHWVGNSLGGALALQLALLQPERARKLVLVNPASSDLGVFNLPLWVQHTAWEPALHLPGVNRLLGLGLRHIAYAGIDVDRAFADQWLAPLQTAGAKAAALTVVQHYGRDLAALEARLCDIGHPALVLWGQCDGIVPRRSVERTAKALANAQMDIFDASAHCPMEEEPQRFNRDVLAFLRS